MDGPRIKQFWHCNPTPSNHKIMKIIIAKNFFLCTQAYYSTPVCLKAGAMENYSTPSNHQNYENYVCKMSAVIKAISRNKCLSIVMKLTGYLLSELFILLSNNPKCNIIIFPDCPEIQGSKLRLCFPYSFHFWIFHIRNYLSSNSILDLYREFKKWKGQSSLPAQAKIWATDFRTVCVQNTNLGKILRCILD